MRVLCFFYAAGERNLGKLYFCKPNGGAKRELVERKRRSIATFGGVR